MNHQEVVYFVIFCGVILWIKIKAIWMDNGKETKSEDAVGFLEMKLVINFYKETI